MKKLLTILTATALSLSAGSFSIEDKARVIKSIPEYKIITKRVPYEECWDEEVPVKRYSQNYYEDDNDNIIGTIIGGAAGGIIGHQIGGGSGKTVATVGGAILGSMVGHRLSKHDRPHREYHNDYQIRKRCSTKYHSVQEEKFIGYKNIATYKGKKIIKISRHKLRYIPVSIRVHF